MDGFDRKARVAKWFETCVVGGGMDRFYDLHVDEIDPEWEDPRSWVNAGLHALEIAKEVRADFTEEMPLTIILTFDLRSRVKRSLPNVTSRERLNAVLSATPPSLYLFRKGEEFWSRALISEQRVDFVLIAVDAASIFGERYRQSECFYMDYLWKGRKEYSRGVYLTDGCRRP